MNQMSPNYFVSHTQTVLITNWYCFSNTIHSSVNHEKEVIMCQAHTRHWWFKTPFYGSKMYSWKEINDLMSFELVSLFNNLFLKKKSNYFPSPFLTMPTFCYSFWNSSFIVLNIYRFLPIRRLYVKERNHFNYIYSSFWVYSFSNLTKTFEVTKES